MNVNELKIENERLINEVKDLKDMLRASRDAEISLVKNTYKLIKKIEILEDDKVIDKWRAEQGYY